jgi:hypothetical protein
LPDYKFVIATYRGDGSEGHTMSFLDAAWHLLNFFAAAVCIGVSSALITRALWRRELRSVAWRRMLVWSVTPAALAALAGLVLTGRDGRMSTYAAMAAACAVGLWWCCFARKT